MEAYKERMIEEYRQVKEWYDRLNNMIIRAQVGTLDFTLTCPLDLLINQRRAMGNYLECLVIRAEIEGIALVQGEEV